MKRNRQRGQLPSQVPGRLMVDRARSQSVYNSVQEGRMETGQPIEQIDVNSER